MSPSSVGPGGLFPLLSFYWQGGGLLQGRSVLSVTERLGCDKGTGLGVGQSTQIGPVLDTSDDLMVGGDATAKC